MKHLTGGKHLQVLLFRQSFPVLAAESLVMELEVDGKRLEIHVVNCILSHCEISLPGPNLSHLSLI